MKYKLEFLERKNSIDGRPAKYENCFHTIRPYLLSTGKYYTGLTTDKEVKEFSKKLGVPEIDLRAPYYSVATGIRQDPNREGKFWETFKIQVGYRGLVLDTDRPLDELTYLFLKGYSKVAKSTDEITVDKVFILKNEEESAIRKNKEASKKRKAYAEMEKMSIDEMRRCLRLLGTKTMNLSNEIVESKMNDVCEKNSDKFFLLWVENKQREWYELIFKCLEYGIMRKERTVYYYGSDILGSSLDATIAYLQSPQQKDLKKSLETQLDAKMKV